MNVKYFEVEGLDDVLHFIHADLIYRDAGIGGIRLFKVSGYHLTLSNAAIIKAISREMGIPIVDEKSAERVDRERWRQEYEEPLRNARNVRWPDGRTLVVQMIRQTATPWVAAKVFNVCRGNPYGQKPTLTIAAAEIW